MLNQKQTIKITTHNVMNMVEKISQFETKNSIKHTIFFVLLRQRRHLV